MIAMAGAPARRGHKPNRHTFRDHFTAQGASEEEVKADVDALVKQGLLVEFDNGQLDALGPGSHIASRE
jgi:ribosomal protein S1